MCQDAPASPGMKSGIQKARKDGSKLSRGGIIRLLRQKSNPPHVSPWTATVQNPWMNWTIPSTLAMTRDEQGAYQAAQHRRQ